MPLCPKHVFSVWDIRGPEGQFHFSRDASDPILRKLYIGCPPKRIVSPPFISEKEKNADTEFLLPIARRMIFMNFYHMSTQNFSLSLTVGKNLSNFTKSLVKVETLIRENDFLKQPEL